MVKIKIYKLYSTMRSFLGIASFLLILAFGGREGFSDLILFRDEVNPDSCVSRGGIILSRAKISDYFFTKDGIPIYVLPVPVTVDGIFADIQICDDEIKVEKLRFRKRKKLRPVDVERIKEEKKILNSMYELTSPKFWSGNFIFPVRDYKKVIENFGVRREINGELAGYHRGIDISADVGAKVLASNSGVIRIARKFTLEGNLVVIDHGEGVFSIYAHLYKIKVKEGDFVKKGEIIGMVGRSGRATGPHLHFGIKIGKTDVNPFVFFEIEDNIDKFLKVSAGM